MIQDQLLNGIQQQTAPVIIDVRSDSEYQSGHVPGALHLPFYSLWSRHSEINSKAEDSIILYCEHGPRAGIAKFALWTLGYTNLVYLEGHMSGWKEEKLPIEIPAENHRGQSNIIKNWIAPMTDAQSHPTNAHHCHNKNNAIKNYITRLN